MPSTKSQAQRMRPMCAYAETPVQGMNENESKASEIDGRDCITHRRYFRSLEAEYALLCAAARSSPALKDRQN